MWTTLEMPHDLVVAFVDCLIEFLVELSRVQVELALKGFHIAVDGSSNIFMEIILETGQI